MIDVKKITPPTIRSFHTLIMTFFTQKSFKEHWEQKCVIIFGDLGLFASGFEPSALPLCQANILFVVYNR